MLRKIIFVSILIPPSLSAQVPFYQALATQCAEKAITMDLYLCANSYVDVATIGSLVRLCRGVPP